MLGRSGATSSRPSVDVIPVDRGDVLKPGGLERPAVIPQGGDCAIEVDGIEWKRLDEKNPRGITARYKGRAVEIMRYESEAMRLVEVTIPVGATDSATPPADCPVCSRSTPWQRSTRLTRHSTRSLGAHRLRREWSLHAVSRWARIRWRPNRSASTLHFYRIEFKRIDGSELHDHSRGGTRLCSTCIETHRFLR
jgi:hypothetical protein